MEGETRGHFAGIGEVILEPYKLAQLAFPDRAMKWVVPKHLTFHDENTVDYASKRSIEIRLDKSRTGVDVDLTQHRVAGVNEAMRCLRRNDDDTASFHLALFISDDDGGAAFEGECDLDVRMLM
jgi:hypothetical protein